MNLPEKKWTGLAFVREDGKSVPMVVYRNGDAIHYFHSKDKDGTYRLYESPYKAFAGAAGYASLLAMGAETDNLTGPSTLKDEFKRAHNMCLGEVRKLPAGHFATPSEIVESRQAMWREENKSDRQNQVAAQFQGMVRNDEARREERTINRALFNNGGWAAVVDKPNRPFDPVIDFAAQRQYYLRLAR